MSTQNATPGRIVLYTLSSADADRINGTFADRNTAHEGDELPAIVIRTFSGGTAANLQVFIDGSGTHWVTSRVEGVAPGTWHWPTRS